MTFGPDRLVRRVHGRLRGGRNAAGSAVDGHELAELVARVERLKAASDAFLHVRLAPNLARERAMVTACIGGGSVATEV